MKLAAYAATPMMLIGIINLYVVQYLTFILFFLAALYGFYILYLGLPILMETPKDQLMPYFIVSIILFIIGWIIILAIWWQYDSWYWTQYFWEGYLYNGW
jgi:cell division protein FtsW (lipid II flippase)